MARRYSLLRRAGVTAGVLLALAFLGAADTLRAAWKVGLAKVKTTPEEPVFLSGYASRDHPSEGVATDIWVKALALSDGSGKRAVLVTSDLIGFRADMAEPICDRIITETGLTRAEILLNSSHTHSGPAVSGKSVIAGKMTQADADRVGEYAAWFSDRVVAVVKEALAAEGRPVTLSHATGVANFVMNRREVTDRGVILGVNPRGPADRSVPVLRVADAETGDLVAVVFQCAAHNTTLGGTYYLINGDYAGYSQEYVQEKHPGVQAMFMLGCAGDANPYPRGTVEDSQAHGIELGAEVCRVLSEGTFAPVEGPLTTVMERVDLPLQPMGSVDEIRKLALGSGSWRQYVAGEMLKLHEKGESLPKHYTAPFALWRFGENLTLVGIPGEVVVDYVYRTEKALGRENRLWVSGYCNDVFGYLPSARILAEGGYETRGVYTGVGIFAPEAEEVAVEAIERLAEEARGK